MKKVLEFKQDYQGMNVALVEVEGTSGGKLVGYKKTFLLVRTHLTCEQLSNRKRISGGKGIEVIKKDWAWQECPHLYEGTKKRMLKALDKALLPQEPANPNFITLDGKTSLKTVERKLDKLLRAKRSLSM